MCFERLGVREFDREVEGGLLIYFLDSDECNTVKADRSLF